MNPSPTLFLLFRRGIPLVGLALSIASILIYPEYLGWTLIAAIAILADLQSTFNTGSLYLAKRSPIVRWDGHWLQLLRPFFNYLNLENYWLLSFCAWNNQRVSKVFRNKKARNAIVLLPHCIQFTKCKAPVVDNLHSCFGCSKCIIKNVVAAAQKYNWDIRVSPRSRMAYNEARKNSPDIVIAVACPDRLVKGLTKLPEVPSYVIPLDLPHGMCVDTTFDFQRLLQAMNTIAEPPPSKIQRLNVVIG
jgi:hypothetical protein